MFDKEVTEAAQVLQDKVNQGDFWGTVAFDFQASKIIIWHINSTIKAETGQPNGKSGVSWKATDIQ